MKINQDVIPFMIPEDENDIIALSEMEGGGTHWSAITFSKKFQRVTLYDSMNGCNNVQAERLAKEISKNIFSCQTWKYRILN